MFSYCKSCNKFGENHLKGLCRDCFWDNHIKECEDSKIEADLTDQYDICYGDN